MMSVSMKLLYVAAVLACVSAMPTRMLLGGGGGGWDDITCPGSHAAIHAGMKVRGVAGASCAHVQAEMAARVNGQYGVWHDPHNNGTYFTADLGSNISFSRATASSTGGSQPYPGEFTDKIVFTLTDTDGGCGIQGCSESQVNSYGDFGTNYCNLKMLYCGTADGCHPVHYDFTVPDEEHHGVTGGSSVSLSGCLVL